MKTNQFEIRVSFQDRGLVVHVNYLPGRPGQIYERNGDPGYPDEPSDCEILRIADEDTREPLAETEIDDLAASDRFINLVNEAADAAYAELEG